jgi:uncharacterized protein YjbJ (UPF0337 family)
VVECLDGKPGGNSLRRVSTSLILQSGAPANCRHTFQEQDMSMNKDQVKGRAKEAEGKIKEVTGKLVGNESLEAKGKVQKILGKAQAKFGDVKQDMKDAKNRT